MRTCKTLRTANCKSAMAIATIMLVFVLDSITSAEPLRTVTVTGEAVVELAPDMAVFETGVITESETASDALRRNSESAAAILSLLKQQGIDAKDIQTTQISVSPQYPQRARQQEQDPRIIGYMAANRMSVRVRKLTQLGNVLDAVVQSGSNDVSGIRFDINDKSDAISSARQQAVQDAAKRAELYARAAGVSVSRVLNIQESGTAVPQMPVMGRAMMMAESVPVAAGQMSVTATVQVTFEID